MLDLETEDLDRELVLVPEIKNVHRELIKESILLQISEAFSSSADYVETFNEQIESTLEEQGVDIETCSGSVRSACLDFYCEVMNAISDEFSLDCDLDTIRDKGFDYCKNACEAMYSFFIIRRKKNIKNMYVGFILKNMKNIVSEYEAYKKKKDVTTVSIKKKVPDSNMALILSNIDQIIGHVSSLDLDMLDMIKYLNMDKFDNEVINELMELSLINSAYQSIYFEPMQKSYQDEAYDEISVSIQKSLSKNIKNKKGGN